MDVADFMLNAKETNDRPKLGRYTPWHWMKSTNKSKHEPTVRRGMIIERMLAGNFVGEDFCDTRPVIWRTAYFDEFGGLNCYFYVLACAMFSSELFVIAIGVRPECHSDV